MMEAARTSETLVNFYQTAPCYNPEDSHLLLHCLFRVYEGHAPILPDTSKLEDNIKMVLKLDVKLWTGFIWRRSGSRGGI
jgi:hypothetical protein